MAIVINTEVAGLQLRELSECDAQSLHALIQRNASHLTKLGDYGDVVSLSRAGVADQLAALPHTSIATGIYLTGTLIGRVDVNCPKRDNYLLGYWIDEQHTSNGYTTAACRSVIRYVHRNLGAKVVWAGVKENNRASIAILERLGFTLFERLPTHLRFRCELTSRANDS